MLSPSASLSRLAISTGSEGETRRRRPSRAPAGDTRSSSVSLAGRNPRLRMSSVKDVIVSSCAIFGSLTNVPAPRRRTRYPSREVVERGSDGQAGHSEIGAQLPLGGDRLAHVEPLDQIEH